MVFTIDSFNATGKSSVRSEGLSNMVFPDFLATLSVALYLGLSIHTVAGYKLWKLTSTTLYRNVNPKYPCIISAGRMSLRLYDSLDLSIIESCLRDDDGNPIPYINPNILDKQYTNPDAYKTIIELDPNVQIDTDVVSDAGDNRYVSFIDVWKNNTMTELPDPVFGITRISKLDNDRVVVYWNVTYIPDAVVNLVSIGRSIPFCKVKFFNVLDKANIRSTFSWANLFKFLQRLAVTGEMRLPHAVIEGTTELKFNNIDSPYEDALEESKGAYEIETKNIPSEKIKILPKIWRLVSHKETLNLVQLLNRGTLKNRKLATDLLEFLDTRRPANFGLNQWNDVILEKVPFRNVPGMRQFDIDGLEAEDQEKLLSTSSTVLGYFTGFIIVCGLGFGTVVMDKIFIRQDQKMGMQKTFANKVHKYVDGEFEEVYYDGF